jgi:hypothetical protein
LQIESRFGGESVCSEVFFEGCAKESSIDQEIERDWRRGIEHRLGIEDLRETISSYIYKLSIRPDSCVVGVLLTGRHKKLPLSLRQLDIRGIGNEVYLDLPLPAGGSAAI